MSTSAPFTLITGGAGFIGTNLADRLLTHGREVVLFDDLSRPGTRSNLEWLTRRHEHRTRVIVADILDERAVEEAVAQATEVYHFAAQVAVTTSLAAPLRDFEVNARGTLVLLEALRRLPEPPPLIFTSTNKVYGALDDLPIRATERRYVPVGEQAGINEQRALDFHSPYGCSKGAADQYVLDYARCFGLPTVVFRMSCIYGPHQHGNEDQGWIAHFLIRSACRQPLVVYGDGRQVRDVLFIDDLLDAFERAMRDARQLAGRAFNIGGGPQNTLSLLELIEQIGERSGHVPSVQHAETRCADQRYYVSDTTAFAQATGWRPQVSVEEGLARLGEWIDQHIPRGSPYISPGAARLKAVGR
jgi:CDP-paratose 2-epimerase